LDERSEAAAGETAGKHEPSHPLFVLTNVLRYIMVLPVFATFITGCALIVYGLMETWSFVEALFFSGHEPDRNHALLLAIEIIDLFLLATVIEVVSLGLYQLHFNENLPLPKWLKIESLDDLKSKLVGVTVTVLAVYFLGQAVISTGGPDILYLGAGSALVIAALSFFLARMDK
jgi:uncharacterized membrane protein YqhA